MKDMYSNTPFLAVGLSPAIQKTLLFDSFQKGKVNRSVSYFTDASGKCINVGRVLVQGGVGVHCLTVAGHENGTFFETLCRKDGLTLSCIPTQGRVRTCTTIVDMSNNECSELVVNEPEMITPREELAFRTLFLQILDSITHSVIISGSRLSGFSDQIIPFMVRKIKEKGLILYCDYRGADLKNSYINEIIRPDYVKINEEEFLETFSESEIKSGLLRQGKKYKSSFIVSRGAESTLTVIGDNIVEVPSKMVQAVNPIGCGDSMTAGLAQGIYEGLNLEKAILMGRDYAARNAQSIHPGWIIGDL